MCCRLKGGAEIRDGFRPDEEPRLRVTLREAWAQGVAKRVSPAQLPASPRGPPLPLVVRLPGEFLRTRQLSRVADHLGAYTLWIDDRPMIFFADEMFEALHKTGLLGELIEIEVEDRLLGMHDDAAHQRRVDAVMRWLPVPGTELIARRTGRLSGESGWVQPADIDAILVPTSRPSSWVNNALLLGFVTEAMVVTLSSGDSSSAKIAREANKYNRWAWLGSMFHSTAGMNCLSSIARATRSEI